MRDEKVTCDGCGRDLTTRSNSVDYRLALDSESKPGRGDGFYTDMMIYPSIDRPHHFCGLKCLDHWSGRRLKRNALLGEKLDAWKAEHGTKDSDGRIRSYLSPPREVSDAWDVDATAAALAAFPMTITTTKDPQ